MYSVVCTVVADVQDTVKMLQPQTGRNGEKYFHFQYQIELLFGLIEHKAQICWKENVGAFPLGVQDRKTDGVFFTGSGKAVSSRMAVVVNMFALFSEVSLQVSGQDSLRLWSWNNLILIERIGNVLYIVVSHTPPLLA